MTSFGATEIFGTDVSMSTRDNPRENRLKASFGLSGLESLDSVSPRRVTHASGFFRGNSRSCLSSAESVFRSFNDGVTRVLIDTLGVAWVNVRLESFQLNGLVRQSPDGMLFRSYSARFFHLE